MKFCAYTQVDHCIDRTQDGVVLGKQTLDYVPLPLLSSFLSKFASTIQRNSASAVLYFSSQGPRFPKPLPTTSWYNPIDPVVFALSRPGDIRVTSQMCARDLGEEIPPFEEDPDLPCEARARMKRTHLPIWITEDDVLETLRTACPAVVVESVHDVSKKYAKQLDAQADRLREKSKILLAKVKEGENPSSTADNSNKEKDGRSAGLKTFRPTVVNIARRMEVFRLMWEAAVVRAGLLKRWEVRLRKPGA